MALNTSSNSYLKMSRDLGDDMVKKVKSEIKRVYNDVKEQFEEVAKTADDIKPL